MRSKKGYAWRIVMLAFCLALSESPLGQSTQHTTNTPLATSQKITPSAVAAIPHTLPHVVQPFLATHNIKQYLRHYLKGK